MSMNPKIRRMPQSAQKTMASSEGAVSTLAHNLGRGLANRWFVDAPGGRIGITHQFKKDFLIGGVVAGSGIAVMALAKRLKRRIGVPKVIDNKDFYLLSAYKNKRIAEVDKNIAKVGGYDVRVMNENGIYEVWIHKKQ